MALDAAKIRSFLQERLDDYLKDLQTLVGIDSNSFDKEGVEAVNAWLEARLKRLGFSVERRRQERFGDDLVATLEGGGDGHVLLLGHSDTVFPKGTAARRPMTLRGDQILGPGTCDMKAGLLAGLYAVEALRRLGEGPLGRITFLVVSDEEIEERHSTELIRSLARTARAALTLEAARANGDIVVARKGVRWFTIEAFGRAAHAGVEPEKGCNAILAMAHHVLALHRLNENHYGGTLNAGVIEGGSTPNVVPDYARLRVDLRAFSDEELRKLVEAVQAQLERQVVPGVQMKMTQEGSGSPPMPYTRQVEALEQLARQAAAELGFTVNGARTGGNSDACIVASEGVPVLDGLGPIGGLDHGPDEYVELSSIVPRTALLARLLLAIFRSEKR